MEIEEEFKPTPAMQRCKASLHRACPPGVVAALQPTDSSLTSYISPTPPVQFRRWHAEKGLAFWEWLLTPPEHDGQALEARDMAYAALKEILSLPLKNNIGDIDHDILKAKQKAIDTVLTKNVPLVAIQNNSGGPSAFEGKMPPGLQKKTPNQIEQMKQRMLQHVPRNDLCIEGAFDDNKQ